MAAIGVSVTVLMNVLETVSVRVLESVRVIDKSRLKTKYLEIARSCRHINLVKEN